MRNELCAMQRATQFKLLINNLKKNVPTYTDIEDVLISLSVQSSLNYHTYNVIKGSTLYTKYNTSYTLFVGYTL